ncbi:MAG: LLM class flavin-dependent oxidoreductase [Pseudonocardia sp.]|nr:LLM class flavin-dependent oxidoreductase [Pseudonocardia sp.]
MTAPLDFGVFYAPFHPVGQDPTLALEYDLERVEALDRFGFDEAWFGEHHSGGYELIGSPEIFIAAAAQRTRHIRLGTGVVSLPYHHPWLLADRLCLLDHLTRGRLIIGTGPGALPTDAYILGIDPVHQRRMHDEGLEAMLALFTSEEPVTRQTDWFTMREARLQVRPYQWPHPEIAVAAMVSPSGPRLAGKYGASLLSLSMSAAAEGFAAIGNAWAVVEDFVEGYRETGKAMIGTPDDAIAYIEDLLEQSGGFGTFLMLGHDWASPAATIESYRLFARHVIPHFKGRLAGPQASHDWAVGKREEIFGRAGQAIVDSIEAHAAETAAPAEREAV